MKPTRNTLARLLVTAGLLTPTVYAAPPSTAGNQLIGFLSSLAFQPDQQLDKVMGLRTPASSPNAAGSTDTSMGRDVNYLLTGYSGYGTNNQCQSMLQNSVSGGSEMSAYYNTISLLQNQKAGMAAQSLVSNYPLSVQMTYLIAMRRLRIPAQLRSSALNQFVNNTGLSTVYDFAAKYSNNDIFNSLGKNLNLDSQLHSCANALQSKNSAAAKTCQGKGKGSLLALTRKALSAVKSAHLTVKAASLGLTTEDVNRLDPSKQVDGEHIIALFGNLIALQKQAVLTQIIRDYSAQAPQFSPYSFDSLIGSTNLIPAQANQATCPQVPTDMTRTSNTSKPVAPARQRQMAANKFVQNISGIAPTGAVHPPSIPLASAFSDQQNTKDPKQAAAIIAKRQQLEAGIIQTQQAYINNRSKLVAAKSVGLSNFHWMLDQRSTPAKAPVPGLKTPSVRDLQAYQAQWRLLPPPINPRTGKPAADAQPTWVASIAKGSPSNATRESAYLLAEIRDQMYRNQLILERLLATVSAMQLASLQGASSDMNSLYQGVKSEISAYMGNHSTQSQASGAMTKTAHDISNGTMPKRINNQNMPKDIPKFNQ